MAPSGRAMVRLLAQGTRHGRTRGSASRRLSTALASTRIAVTGHTRRMARRDLAARRLDAHDLVSAAGSSPGGGAARSPPRPASVHPIRGRGGGILVGRTLDRPETGGRLQPDV